MKQTVKHIVKHVLLGVVALAALLLVGGCSRQESLEEVELPVTPVLTLRAGWAVASVPYTPVVDTPAFDAPIEGHLRRGEIVEVVAKTNYAVRREGEEHFWYQVRGPGIEGWIYGSQLILTASREQAVNAAEDLGTR